MNILYENNLPETGGGCGNLWVDDLMWGMGTVRRTPALVPIHKRSLHDKSAVTRRQAALCCRIISSQPAADIIIPLK